MFSLKLRLFWDDTIVMGQRFFLSFYINKFLLANKWTVLFDVMRNIDSEQINIW